jgi:hypothetical protein
MDKTISLPSRSIYSIRGGIIAINWAVTNAQPPLLGNLLQGKEKN